MSGRLGTAEQDVVLLSREADNSAFRGANPVQSKKRLVRYIVLLFIAPWSVNDHKLKDVDVLRMIGFSGASTS